MRHEDRHEDSEFFILNGQRWTTAELGLRHRMVFECAKALRTEFLREMWRQIRAWYHRRIARAQLQSLDDATLKDIGLHRSGIESAVEQASANATSQKRRAFPEKPQLCLHRTG